MTAGPKDHRNFAPRSSKADVDARIQAVYTLLVNSTRTDEIIAFATEKWGVKRRIVEVYIRRARAMVSEQANQVRANYLEMALASHQDMRRQAIITGDARLALDIDKEDAKLLGAYAPGKNYNLEIDLSKLSDEQLERIANGEDPVTVLKPADPGQGDN